MVSGPVPTVDPIEPIGFLARPELDRLIEALQAAGRRVIGPTIADGAVVYDGIASQADLPAGWRADQAPGRYRLEHRGGARLFDYVVGPTAWKRFTFPPRVPVTVGRREGGAVDVHRRRAPATLLAFLGVRGCELAALGIQDTVLMAGPAVDSDYAARDPRCSSLPSSA